MLLLLLQTHQHHWLLIQLEQLILKEWVLFFVDLLFDLDQLVSVVLRSIVVLCELDLVVVACLVWVLCIDNDLFKSENHLHFLFVDLGLNNVFH